MWRLQPEADYERRANKWPKKYRRELVAVHDNLDTFLGALNRGATPEQAKFGFVHPEPCGVLAIDQKGGGPSLKETRLYTYPNTATQLLHLITLGDKDSQRDDIKRASEFVAHLKKQKEEDGNG